MSEPTESADLTRQMHVHIPRGLAGMSESEDVPRESKDPGENRTRCKIPGPCIPGPGETARP
jgi:hypothetical protein